VQFTSAINQRVVPKVLFTGLKVDFKKELSLAFGDYCEVYVGTDNTSSGRAAPCLALHPCNNATGSWTFYNLRTHARICKSQWTKMVTTQLIVDAVNALDAKSPPTFLDVIQLVGDETEATPPSSIPVSVPEATPEQPVGDVLPDSAPEPVEAPGVAPNEDPAPEVEDAGDEPPELVAAGGDDSDDEAEESDDENESSDVKDDENEDGGVRRSARITAGVQPLARYTMVTRLHQGSHNNVRRNKGIKKAEIEEVLMCFVTLGALLPVLKLELEDAVALSCHMFTIEKFLANGEHDKFKTRIVAHGNKQDILLYPDRSSPTVSMQAIMACLAIAAYNNNLKLAKINVKGAFIQTKMKGRPVYIRCNKKLTQLITEVIPGIRRYVCQDGTLYCRLLKALYGCVQASKLWYEKLIGFLEGLGYERCPVEPCVMRRVVEGVVYTLLIYVDDVLVIATEAEFERLREAFTKEFRWITMEVSNILSYLGMQVELHRGYAIIDMLFYIEKILKDCENLGKQGTPGLKTTFEVDKSTEELGELKKRSFIQLWQSYYIYARERGLIL
jgi:hypothetical protein